MPRLNHFSIVCEDPENLRQFYGRWFGFEELTRGAGGAIYLTDGYFSVGLLPQGSEPAEGSHRRRDCSNGGLSAETAVSATNCPPHRSADAPAKRQHRAGRRDRTRSGGSRRCYLIH